MKGTIMTMLDNRAAGQAHIGDRIKHYAALEKMLVQVGWDRGRGDRSLLKLTSGGNREEYPIPNPALESQDRPYQDKLAEGYLREFMQDISS
jgi:hypothetical protein